MKKRNAVKGIVVDSGYKIPAIARQILGMVKYQSCHKKAYDKRRFF